MLPDGRGYEEIAIRHGDEYFFYAERYNGGRLVVTEVRPGPAPEDERTVPPMLETPYTVYYRHLAELVKNPRFVFNVSPVDGKDPSERVRVTFNYDWKGESVPRIREGWIDLCPRADWAVQEFLIKVPSGILIRRKIQYGEGSGPQKPLVEVRTSYLGLDGKAEGDHDVGRFKKQSLSPKPDEFYSFSAVGFPELNTRNFGSRGAELEVQPKTVSLLLAPDEERQVEIQISNHSPTSCSVVGGTFGCSREFYIGNVSLPVDVPPGATTSAILSVGHQKTPGSFSSEFVFYTSSSDQPTISVTVKIEVSKPR